MYILNVSAPKSIIAYLAAFYDNAAPYGAAPASHRNAHQRSLFFVGP